MSLKVFSWPWPRLLVVLSMVALAAISGCGVESGTSTDSGASGAQLAFSGRVLTAAGVPIADLQLSIPATDARGTTDSDGNFSFTSSAVSGDIPVELSPQSGGTFTVIVGPIPPGAENVAMTLMLDLLSGMATVTDIAVDAEEPNPELTPTPSPGQTPRATPTPNPESDRAAAIKKGQRIYRSICSDCHGAGKGTGKTASQLRVIMQKSQHQGGFGLTRSDLAALSAYLNQ